MQFKGSISMPKELEQLLKDVKDKKSEAETREIEPDSEGHNRNDYLSTLPRKVDIMLMCVFYGLYSSRDLPPMDVSEYTIEGPAEAYDFNVDMTQETEQILHMMLLIWICQKGPFGSALTSQYRSELYLFLKKILDDDFMYKVAFPYYLEKAARSDGDISFIAKLRNSRYVEWKTHPYAPESIALNLERLKQEFEEQMKVSLSPILNP